MYLCNWSHSILNFYSFIDGTLLLAGGYNSDDKVEIINLDKAESCNSGYEFPAGYSYRFPMSAYIAEKETLMVCGGTSSNGKYGQLHHGGKSTMSSPR